jgi:hypothetical protein
MGSSSRPRRRWLALPVAIAVAGLELVTCALPATAAHASVPPNPAWKSSAPFGEWNNGGFDVYNNEWNTSEAGPQTIWADSFKHWGVESNQAPTTSVKTYPSVQRNYDNRGYGTFGSIRSTYAESMPSAGNYDAEAAYDMWLNNYKIEVMIWVDNHGQRPAGSVVARASYYGQTFSVWKNGSDMYSLVLSGKKQTTGTVHILSALRYLVNHGYLSSSDTMKQVNFGWEIASTGGTALDFTVTRYSLATTRKG